MHPDTQAILGDIYERRSRQRLEAATDSSHPEGSDSTIVARLRDSAILSWLRDRADGRPNRTSADLDRDSLEQNENQAPSNHLSSELDQVFASLGASSRI